MHGSRGSSTPVAPQPHGQSLGLEQQVKSASHAPGPPNSGQTVMCCGDGRGSARLSGTVDSHPTRRLPFCILGTSPLSALGWLVTQSGGGAGFLFGASSRFQD